jgi:hypothetical protein
MENKMNVQQMKRSGRKLEINEYEGETENKKD